MNYLMLILVFFLFACKNNNKKVENNYHEDNYHEKENFVKLNKEEIELFNIKTQRLTQKSIKQVLKANGYVEAPPNSKVSVHSLIDGHIYESYFLKGDYVKKGELLITLSSFEYIDMQKNYLLIKNNLEFIEKDLERKKTLYDQNVISEKEYQKVKTNYYLEKYKLQSIDAKFKLMKISNNKDINEINPFIKIYSPINGYITVDNTNKGKYITTNYMLYELINKEHLHVEIQVYQNDIDKIKPNSPFWFYVDNVKFSGEVELINQKLDKQTKTINLHGHLFNNLNKQLKHDMYVVANIVTNDKSAIAINIESIINEDDQYFIFVSKDEGFYKIKIDIGIESEDLVEIKSINEQYSTLPVVIQGANTLNNILRKDDFSGHSH